VYGRPTAIIYTIAKQSQTRLLHVTHSAGTAAKLKNKRTKNEQMLTDVRLPGQLIVSDQMLIASKSRPYFGNTFVICPACRLDLFPFPFLWSNMQDD
jgi:hypothetical protein